MAQNQALREATSIPPEEKFSTKPALARELIEKSQEAKVPFSWVVADSIYEITKTLHELRKGYVLGTTSKRQYHFFEKMAAYSASRIKWHMDWTGILDSIGSRQFSPLSPARC